MLAAIGYVAPMAPVSLSHLMGRGSMAPSHICLKYKLYLVYVSNKLFLVLKNYVIELSSHINIKCVCQVLLAFHIVFKYFLLSVMIFYLKNSLYLV